MGDQPRRGAWGRGRAKAPPPAQQQQKQQEPPKPIGAPLQGAWARRPGAPTAPAQPSTSAQQSIGRGPEPVAASRSTPPAQAQAPRPEQPPGGGGGDASSMGRGALRGRRQLPPELLITRPSTVLSKQGTEGKSVQVQANYFKVLNATDWCLYKYRVDFAPEEDRIQARKGMLGVHRDKLGAYIFDGTVLYTSNRLPQPLEVFSKRRSDDANIQIVIRLVGDISKGDEHYLQFYNIIMRKCLEYLQLQLVGRNYFDARNKVEVPQYKLELWPGYETSIRQHETNILMCAEITHKVMRQQTLLDILNECYNKFGNQYQERFKAMVIGVTVLTDYNNHTYRVDDVDYSQSPNSTFTKKGEEISYKEYYRIKYQINIRHSTQPLLLSKSKDRDRRAGASEMVCLIPELCRSTGLTDAMREDRTMMRELATYTRLDPRGRINRLMSFNKRLHDEPQVVTEFRNWNLQLDNKLVTLPARILPTEEITFGQGRSTTAGDKADWTFSLRSNPMLETTRLNNWVMVIPNRVARDAEAFVGTLKGAVKNMNFQIASPRNYILSDDRAAGYTSAIEEIMSQANPQLIFCLVMNNRADRYAAIKKKCCIDRPVPTQCMLAKNMSAKGVQSIATKIAIQMNCKIGGAPWAVNIPASGLMVAGFDVCHDTNSKGRDFGALVASLDRNFSRYFSAVSAHTNGEELSNDLGVNMCKALQKYKEINKALPSRIVIYRDGVGEGQIPFVLEHEVERLQAKLASLYGNANLVKMTYIIVTKRINTRLFYNGGNPAPGTVVDDVITSPLKYDFFVVSQFTTQGSVSPTSYSVIADTSGLSANQLQKLSYKLTHMYFNWSGTVRVPAPCQFAHKLAFLVSQSIHASPSNHLETLLYFL
ncbi:piwi-like protein Siwi [Venturia canescens]|uniref:piwi-like protein Siwi n=1 Tax=Venturia canescens TaxID=32260 RepID=UPI001C9BD680|nr:piwi-like protein Siwi [Venturia canescens]